MTWISCGRYGAKILSENEPDFDISLFACSGGEGEKMTDELKQNISCGGVGAIISGNKLRLITVMEKLQGKQK